MIRCSGSFYDGEDRRITPYSNIEEELLKALLEEKTKSQVVPPIIEQPEKKLLSMPFIWQILTTVGTVLVMGFGLYQTSHDDQLMMRTDFKNFQERYKEDQDRHNQTHNKIFDEIKDIKQQTQSLEDSFQQVMTRKR